MTCNLLIPLAAEHISFLGSRRGEKYISQLIIYLSGLWAPAQERWSEGGKKQGSFTFLARPYDHTVAHVTCRTCTVQPDCGLQLCWSIWGPGLLCTWVMVRKEFFSHSPPRFILLVLEVDQPPSCGETDRSNLWVSASQSETTSV